MNKVQVSEQYTEEFESLWTNWRSFFKRPTDSKQKAYKAYAAQLKKGITLDHINYCLKNYAQDMKNQGNLGTNYVLMLASFINGRLDQYEEEVAVNLPSAQQFKKTGHELRDMSFQEMINNTAWAK